MSDVYSYPNEPVVRSESIKNTSLDAPDIARVLPRQVSTGSTRGTQTVGYGNTKIDGSTNTITVGANIVLDGSNKQITVTNTDGSKVGIGLIPGSTADFGFFVLDAAGHVLVKIVSSTLYAYDIVNDKNVMQILKLPDGTYGWAVAKSGKNVADGF